MADQNDYHGHPNYNMVFYALTALMVITVLLDEITFLPKHLVVLMVFAVAIAKAYLVMANFMHLKYEPKLVDLFPYLSIALMIILFFGVAPDTILIPLTITE